MRVLSVCMICMYDLYVWYACMNCTCDLCVWYVCIMCICDLYVCIICVYIWSTWFTWSVWCIFMRVCAHVWEGMNVNMHTCMCAYMYVCECVKVNMQICMCVYMYICVCMCACMHEGLNEWMICMILWSARIYACIYLFARMDIKAMFWICKIYWMSMYVHMRHKVATHTFMSVWQSACISKRLAWWWQFAFQTKNS